MVVDRIYLDANTIIIAFEWQDVIAGLLEKLFLLAGGRTAKAFVTSELTFAELLVVPYRDGDQTAIETYEHLMRGSDWLDVVAVDDATLRYAARVRAKHKGHKLPDAIHIATAINGGCSHILTGDTGIRGRYDDLIASELGNTYARSLDILRPDASTLTSLIESLSA